MASSTAFTVARAPASETYALRAEVLHGGAAPVVAKVAGDDHPDVATFAARDTDGVVIGCVGLFPELCPDRPGHAGFGWRLRRLATAESWRGRGVGTAVLTAAIQHAAAQGPGLVWCNATPAGVALIVRAGFWQVGMPWTDPEFGSNVRLLREV
ncbi:putative GNAT family N-acyltransferase [Nocardioides albertanoniae]|uniref:Putative GNAT family N-acyltransferase n=1 Tax=Nocardioides albertanoniae TaxID=1175486 RepID=A0A543AAU1_9ACTN|nr:GNAT family N-acetyltransferase [Nocardioides albertanoniae]TQL69721.1 putative GNAT family N-acyltransferase [Nocardioides albertanoniae]